MYCGLTVRRRESAGDGIVG